MPRWQSKNEGPGVEAFSEPPRDGQLFLRVSVRCIEKHALTENWGFVIEAADIDGSRPVAEARNFSSQSAAKRHGWRKALELQETAARALTKDTAPVLLEAPLPRAEGYVIHLYCKYTAGLDHDMRTHGVEFGGASQADARGRAKQAGWLLHRSGLSTCPECARQRKN